MLATVYYRDLTADDSLDPGSPCRLVEPRRAVDAVAIDERERRVAQRRRAFHERLGQRRRLEEAEGGGSV
jgi:hypothetical protein